MSNQSTVAAAVEEIRRAAHHHQPRVAIVLGSGLGPLADELEPAIRLDYSQIIGFPVPSVHGHAGHMVLGRLCGVEVICLVGRAHLYEGMDKLEALKTMVRSLKGLGVEILILTNAAGSLRSEVGSGELVMIKDHVNFQGTNPLVGPNDEHFGPRFVDLEDCWDPELRGRMRSAAEAEKVTLHEGVYAAWMGPAFETPAEIRMLQIVGCDTVGMSTVPECILARHCGLRVVGISVMTNLACGLSPVKLSHEGTLAEAQRGLGKLTALVKRFLTDL